MFSRKPFKTHTLAALAMLTAASALLATSTRAAQPHAMAGDVQIIAPWVRATPPGMKMAAGYMTLVNTGDSAEALVGASVAFADRVELHRTEVVDDVATMRQLDAPLAIEPGATVNLEPGGLHVMFIGVNEPLVAGQTVALRLQFAHSGDLDVEFPVKSMPGTMQKHSNMQHGTGGQGAMQQDRDMTRDQSMSHDQTMAQDQDRTKDQDRTHDGTHDQQHEHQTQQSGHN